MQYSMHTRIHKHIHTHTHTHTHTLYTPTSSGLDPPGEEGRVRLTGGPDNTTGRLEVYEYGRWGSVCSNEFDANDALVACKQLGFDGTLGFNDR